MTAAQRQYLRAAIDARRRELREAETARRARLAEDRSEVRYVVEEWTGEEWRKVRGPAGGPWMTRRSAECAASRADGQHRVVPRTRKLRRPRGVIPMPVVAGRRTVEELDVGEWEEVA